MVCNKCNNNYDESFFYKGQGNRCKDCAKKHRLKYQSENADKIAENKRRYYKEVVIRNRNKQREILLPERQAKRELRKYEANQRAIIRRIENAESIRSRQREWAKNNREKINANLKRRLAEDIEFRISAKLRTLIYVSLKGRGKKSDSTLSLTGCTIQELKAHLESLFKPGMTWQNHSRSGWHIDHIIPCASFNLSDPDEQKKCFHYTNLQPLWAEENLRKSNKITLRVA